ncbi:MAG: D-alanyl-D-alanine carboxypeptidase [Desulfobacterium sp.]|nr:D-alanyl-D-alanine carboxypeptidase [Desulfobacterium sp.]
MKNNKLPDTRPFLQSLKCLMICVCVFSMGHKLSQASVTEDSFKKFLGKNDSLLVSEISSDTNLIRIQADQMLIPASILKLFTALVAMNALGDDYHFHTDFFSDPYKNLKIKGYGDPLLISEIIPEMVHQIGDQIHEINDIILDDTYFQSPMTIPGATKKSVQPYDAPNGSLCVNFNTVFFKKDQNGAYISAESQTPLLPFIADRIARSSLDHGRIILSDNNHEHLLYAGHIFKHFLESEVSVKGMIRQGAIDKNHDALILRYRSPYSIQDIIEKMLHYSSNFTANQILIAAGAAKFGEPGTLAKGIQVAHSYAATHHGLSKIQFQEGSGLSTLNRLSANMMSQILKEFFPYRNLLRKQGRELYKTGTLTGVRSRVGYLQTRTGKLLSFVVILNSNPNSMENIMKLMNHFY